MKTGKQIFEELYDRKIKDDECLEYTEDKYEESANWNYLLRKDGVFNNNDLVEKLLNNKYYFKVVNQKEIQDLLAEKEKQDRISRLEKELERLRGY